MLSKISGFKFGALGGMGLTFRISIGSIPQVLPQSDLTENRNEIILSSNHLDRVSVKTKKGLLVSFLASSMEPFHKTVYIMFQNLDDTR